MTTQAKHLTQQSNSLEITRKADITKFAVDLTKTAIVFDVEMKKERIQAYYDIFSKKFTDEHIRKACEYLQENFKPEYGVKFPVPRDFIELMKNYKEEDEKKRREIEKKKILDAEAQNKMTNQEVADLISKLRSCDPSNGMFKKDSKYEDEIRDHNIIKQSKEFLTK